MSLSVNRGSQQNRETQRGAALALLLHVVLLLLVLGQIVYLASRVRVRVDLTSDQRWSSTQSTRILLDKLDKRLVIEAYFSPKDTLPVTVREARVWADNFLDELVQIGRGKVVLQRFDPNADKAVADRATRLGIKPLNLRSQSATSLSLDQHWLGLRLVYGGGKQKVVEQFAPVSSFAAEALLTPAIKEVLTGEKRRFGYVEWPEIAVGSQTPGGIGWSVVRTHEGISKRYEFQNYKDEDGALLPLDLETLFLFRPRDVTDRQKYVLDQFVVRGGTLVVFADAAEYALGQQRTMTRVPFQLDASGSDLRFTDQLRHYGLDWRPQVLADVAQQAYAPRDRLRMPEEYLAVVQPNAMGFRQSVWVPYPYFFHAVHKDWSEVADELARSGDGRVDAAIAARYREVFGPGMPSEEFLFSSFQKIGRGPGFYWPTWVGLREKAAGVPDLPAGVDGRVLLWSSPAVLAEDPPQSVDPIGRDPRLAQSEVTKWLGKLHERLAAEPRQQAPLMVEVRGSFASFFDGRAVPKRPSEIKEEKAQKAAGEGGEGNEPTPGNPDEGPQLAAPPTASGAEKASAGAAAAAARAPGRIVLVGDATFLRDDVVRGDLRQVGGPFSGMTAMPFFAQLLDWLSEDRDLVDLQSRAPIDRTIVLVDADPRPGADPRLGEQQLRRKTTWLRALNVLVPSGILSTIGLIVLLLRRRRKQRFLASLPGRTA
jgi:ABC-type uncharacterized transport system involved in gliding motility auxiliary subunit